MRVWGGIHFRTSARRRLRHGPQDRRLLGRELDQAHELSMRTRLPAIVGCCLALALGASAQGHDEARPGIEAIVRQIAQELSAICPLADPGDQNAFEACRGLLFAWFAAAAELESHPVVGTPQAGSELEGYDAYAVRARSLDRSLCAHVHVRWDLAARLRRGRAAIPGSPRRPVPQRPRPRPVSLSVLARREEVERLPGRQYLGSVDRAAVRRHRRGPIHQ